MHATDFAQQNVPRFVDELKTLLRIPSISTDPTHTADVRAAADLCRAELERIGMHHARLIETTTDEQISTNPDGVSRVIPARLGHPEMIAGRLQVGRFDVVDVEAGVVVGDLPADQALAVQLPARRVVGGGEAADHERFGRHRGPV